MSTSLSGIPVAKRRQLAATLGLFAVLFVAVGAVGATGASTALVKAFVAIALLVALLLALMAWGVVHSVRLDRADRRLDAAIEAAVRASGRSMCDCGHEHDPDELHFTDGPGQHLTGSKPGAACAHDGQGAACAHDCDTCVLAAARVGPDAAARVMHGTTAGPQRRPSPGPRRPSPSSSRP